MAKAAKQGKKPDDSEVWWTFASPKEAAAKLVEWCNESITANVPHACEAYRFGQLFRGYTLTDLAGFGAEYAKDNTLEGLDIPVIRNKCRRQVLSFVGKATANDSPRHAFTTKDADYEMMVRAQNLDDAIQAELDQHQGQFADIDELHRHGVTIAAGATGEYWCFVFPGDGRPEAELDDGLTIGHVRSGRYGAIVTLCRTVWRSVEWLIARNPGEKNRAEILKCVESVVPGITSGQIQGKEADGKKLQGQRMVRVHQGWRVKVGDTMGREMFCLKNGHVLKDDKEYDRTKPPGRRWVYELDLDADRGVPLTHTIYRQCMRQNEITVDFDNTERNTPQVTLLIQSGTEAGASVKKQMQESAGIKLVDVPGDVSSVVKEIPTPGFARNSVQLEQLYDKGIHEDSGISPANINATKGNGATSGIQEAMRASVFTENFADQERRLVRFRAIDVPMMFATALQDIIDDDYEAWVGNDSFRRKIQKDDLDLDLEKYVVDVKAVSEEKDSPATRIAKVDRMLKDPTVQFTGADWNQAMKTLDERASHQRLSEIIEWVEEQVTRWLRMPESQIGSPKFYQSPQKWMRIPGLEAALDKVTVRYLRAKQDGAPEHRLRFFETFMSDCVEQIRQLEREEGETKNVSVSRKDYSEPSGGQAGPPAAGPPPQ